MIAVKGSNQNINKIQLLVKEACVDWYKPDHEVYHKPLQTIEIHSPLMFPKAWEYFLFGFYIANFF